jgi:DNA polymerase III alpha subunit
VGEKAAAEILRCRPYKDFEDFYDKVSRRIINKNVVKILIENGAFRCIDPDVNYNKLTLGKKKTIAKKKE